MSKEASRSGRNGKSSKTARVMNLLIDPEALAENDTAASGGAASGTSAPTAGAKRAANDKSTGEQIRSALETELIDSAIPALRKPAPQPEAAAAAEQVQTPPEQPAASSAPDIPPELPAQDVPAPQPPAPQEEALQSEPALSVPEEPVEDDNYEAIEGDENENDNVDDYICFNVTQALVEDKAEKYMKMFGMCTCNRCRIDVVALALSNLPAKYVVAKPKDMIPRLSMYEAKYSAAVITQVMKACKKVIELPHHKR